MREWPTSIPKAASGKREIEDYLRSVIRREQPTLLGELDLNIPVDYAELNWSLLDLADYQIENKVIVNNLADPPHLWKYPATLA